MYMRKEWYYKRKVSHCQGLKQTFADALIHTTLAALRRSPAPPGQGRLEKVQPCVRTRAQPSSRPSWGRGGTCTYILSYFSGKMLLFSFLCST